MINSLLGGISALLICYPNFSPETTIATNNATRISFAWQTHATSKVGVKGISSTLLRSSCDRTKTSHKQLETSYHSIGISPARLINAYNKSQRGISTVLRSRCNGTRSKSPIHRVPKYDLVQHGAESGKHVSWSCTRMRPGCRQWGLMLCVRLAEGAGRRTRST